MPAYEHRLPEFLRPLVSSCVGYDFRLDPASVHHGLPSTSLTLIFAFDEPLDCGWLDATDQSAGRYDVLLSGLHVRPALIRTHGKQVGIQLDLTPSGARVLCGLPAGELTAEIVDAVDVGIIPRDLHRRMQQADWPSRFAALDAFLAERAVRASAMLRPELTRSWNLLCETRGQLSVADLAREVGFSRRHLLTLFRAEFGLAPKQLARIARFEYARSLLDASPSAAVAADLSGYADQAHLSREFRELAGFPPSGLSENFPIVQDADGDGQARSKP